MADGYVCRAETKTRSHTTQERCKLVAWPCRVAVVPPELLPVRFSGDDLQGCCQRTEHQPMACNTLSPLCAFDVASLHTRV